MMDIDEWAAKFLSIFKKLKSDKELNNEDLCFVDAAIEYLEDLENTAFPLEERCVVEGCYNLAVYEGWYRVKDFSGNLTGLNRSGYVCEEHKMLLIGFENKETESA